MDAHNRFRFEDTGESVQERLDKFEERLTQATTGLSKKDSAKNGGIGGSVPDRSSDETKN